MTFTKIHHIPEPESFIKDLPLSANLNKVKKERDKLIKDILIGKSNKFLLIIGPCSADNEDSVCDYVSRLGKLQDEVKDKIVLVSRIFTNKPRTTGSGYKGMLHQPDPNAKPDLLKGIKKLRSMHIRAINESHLTAADEMLYPENYAYLEDLLSYVTIGARSTENQQHRLVCSGLDIPVGTKNPTGGDLTVMLNSVFAVQNGHQFKYHDYEVKTDGNPLAHCILRGAINYYGINIPNYHYETLMRVSEEYNARELPNPAIIVDTNHSNSMKKYKEQPRIAYEVLNNMKYSPTLKKLVKGFLIESYIEEGCQSTSCGTYGQSVTDPCLGWDDTKKLILNIADSL